MRFGILGPLEARDDSGRPLALGGRKQRAVLAILLSRANEVVSSDRLIDELWSGEPPASAAKSLQVHVSRLRSALTNRGADREERIATATGGYQLRVGPGELDRDQFERLLAEGAEASRAGAWALASERFRDALGLWRGRALSDFQYDSFAQAEIARLSELQVAASEQWIEAELALGHEAAVIGDLERLVREHPYRERLHGQLMLALYRAGRQADALGTYRATRSALVEQLGIEPSAALRELHDAILAQDTSLLRSATGADRTNARSFDDSAHETSAGPAMGSLPLREIPLIGRDRELADVSRLLVDRGVAVLTLTGTGGTGKTSLALEAARQALPAFAGDVALVELASIVDAVQVVSELVRTLEIRLAAGETPLAALKRVLRSRRMLLVLDNFEHVLDAAQAVAELVDACPSLKVLVTSRAPLRLARERIYPVSTLEHPDPGGRHSEAELVRFPAVALFAERARSHNPDFAVSDANAASIAALCAHLGGLPLGLELAASLAGVFSPEAILIRLKSRAPTSGAAGRRDAPPRHATLDATIGWSYRLLSSGQRVLFERLGVFLGGFTFSAAEFVLEGPTASVLQDLQALLDHGLVLRARQKIDEPRFEMLEPIRQYALERLGEDGRLQDALTRHASYYGDFAESAESALHSADQEAWLDALDAEQPNLRAVLQRCEEIGAVDLGLRIAGALVEYWGVRDLAGEIQAWLGPTLERHHSPPRVRVKALHALGAAASWVGDVDAARRALDECLSLAARTDVGPAAESEAQKARADYMAGDLAGAEFHASRARALAPADGDKWTRLLVLLLLVGATDDYEVARRDSEEALTLSSVLGDRLWPGWLNSNLAFHALVAGDIETARRSNDEGLLDAARQGPTDLKAVLVCQAAMIRLIQGGDLRTAERELRWALAVGSRTGDREFLRETLNGLAAVAFETGDPTHAATLAAAAEALHEHPRSPLSELIRHRFLGTLPDAALAGCDPLTELKVTPARTDGLIAALTTDAVPVEPFGDAQHRQEEQTSVSGV